jgi:hypothetical protein
MNWAADSRETLNKLIPLMPFDYAQEGLVEGLVQCLPGDAG